MSLLVFPSPCGDVLYSPPPSKRGRWRAVRAGRGAYSGCAFLTMEMRRSIKAPLPPCFAWSPSPAVAGEALDNGNQVSLASPEHHGGGGPLAVEGAPVTCMTFLR